MEFFSILLGGIIAIYRGDSSGTFHFEGNHFDNIGFRPHALSTFDTAYIQADILNSSANNIGAFGEFTEFANADSILMQLHNSSKQDVVVDGYTYDNTDQVGGISNTGLELIIIGPGIGFPEESWANNAEATLKINNSSFSNAVTEAMQLNNIGTNSLMSVEITNTTVFDANPRQIGAALGLAGAAISVIPEFFGNSGSQTFLKVENCDIVGSTGYSVGVYDVGTTGFSTVVDMGGGALGSIGQNRILENVAGEIVLNQTDGIGESNWWGQDPPRLGLHAGSSFDVDPVLVADPRP